MSADSLHIPLSHLIRWADTTAQVVPHSGNMDAAWTFFFTFAAVAIVSVVAVGFLASWIVRGMP